MSTTPRRDAAPAREGAPVQRAGRKRSSMAKAEQRAGLTLISPTLIIVLVMIVLPILWTIMLAFQQIRLLNLRTAGILGNYTISNFTEVFSSPGFLEALLVTLVYSVAGTGLAIGFGLIAALALRKPFRGRTLVRAATLIPYVAPIVAVTFVWTTMLNPQFGIVNHWGTQFLGWDQAIPFLSERQRDVSFLGLTFTVPTALLTVIAFEAWRSFPFAFLFLTARLQAVPASLDEAARVDGATPTQRFRYILLPQLLPTIAVLSVLRFIWTFNSFDDIYLLTGGGAGTEVVAVRVYNFLISRGDIGAASAQALVLAVILAVLVGIYLKFFAKKEEVS
ncbi:sugar ABC transporter permease [Arthrobacter sp. H5]|uniref:carbohydrate ABC transporter permease n=1 Tax=Arthrobacter sp. H5 TaxID=1267973 RepID=UPI000489AB99|nr:sugar ABC transporter permease [Arthrobacter sp. H5]